MKTVIQIVICSLFAGNLLAQPYTDDMYAWENAPVRMAGKSHPKLSAGYGISSSCAALDRVDKISPRGISEGMLCDNRQYTGAFHVQYTRCDSTSMYVPVDLCFLFAYEQVRLNAYLDNIETGQFADRFYTALVGINVSYFQRKWFAIYGGMYVGGTVATRRFTANEGPSDVTTIARINFQLIPLGIRLGNRIGVYAEGGWGAKGSFCAGAFAKF